MYWYCLAAFIVIVTFAPDIKRVLHYVGRRLDGMSDDTFFVLYIIGRGLVSAMPGLAVILMVGWLLTGSVNPFHNIEGILSFGHRP